MSLARFVLGFVLLANIASLEGQTTTPGPEWRWRFIAGGATTGTGAFAPNGTFYFAAEDRYLYALDPNGTMIWRTDLGLRPAGGVVVSVDGSVLVTLSNGELLALNPDGRLIWRERVSPEPTFSPTVLANGMIVTVKRPGLIEARTHFGRLLWSLAVDAVVSTAPIVAGDGNLLVATARGELLLVSVDGREVRKRYVGEIASAVAAEATGTLIGSTGGRVIRVDADLEPVWRADVGSAVRSLAIGSTDDIYATSDDGSVSRITASGVLAWRAELGSPVTTALAGDDVLVSLAEGFLVRLGRDGVVRWRMAIPGRVRSIAAGTSPIVIATTENWVTYAYPVDFSVDGAWPEDRGGSDRRGVVRGADSGRVDLEVFAGSVRYLALRRLLLAGGQSEQVVAVSGIASRVRERENLAGSHQYLLQLTESVAGSPYFGPLSATGPRSAPRRARDEAVWVLGEIGDLATARFLGRLLAHEPDASMQASILQSMARLGTPVDENLAALLYQIVRDDIADRPDDALGLGVARFVAVVDEYRGGYLHPRTTEALLTIVDGNYSRRVRDYALEALRALAGGSAP